MRFEDFFYIYEENEKLPIYNRRLTSEEMESRTRHFGIFKKDNVYALSCNDEFLDVEYFTNESLLLYYLLKKYREDIVQSNAFPEYQILGDKKPYGVIVKENNIYKAYLMENVQLCIDVDNLSSAIRTTNNYSKLYMDGVDEYIETYYRSCTNKWKR